MIPNKESDAENGGAFRTTHWSVVLAAQDPNSLDRSAALTALCESYWYPLYAFVRRLGRNAHDAEDLTQEFLARLLEKSALISVHPEHGRFRSFLLASLKNFLANDWDRNHTAKRGGEFTVISWDDRSGEDRYLQEPSHDSTPEKLFEQSWALTVIATVMEQLKKDYAEAGKGPLFEAIQLYLADDGGPDTYAGMGQQLGMAESAIKMAVLRLRESFRRRLRLEIAQTVVDPGDVDEELRHLFICLAN